MTHNSESDGFCSNCGASIFADSNFCHKCGSPISRKNETDNAPSQSDDSRLYDLMSYVNNFRYEGILYDNLKINWFIVGREQPQIPFENAISNYEQLPLDVRVHPENYIKERFTRQEALLLKRYLETVQKVKVELEELNLPIDESKTGYRAFPPGPGTDFIQLHKKSNYNLAFKVDGIFNVKLADQRIVPDDGVTVISRSVGEYIKKITQKAEINKTDFNNKD